MRNVEQSSKKETYDVPLAAATPHSNLLRARCFLPFWRLAHRQLRHLETGDGQDDAGDSSVLLHCYAAQTPRPSFATLSAIAHLSVVFDCVKR
jgi:hypothetical protein